MKVIKNHHPCEDPINYLGFEELAQEGLGSDCIFFYGGHANNLVFEPSNKPKYFFSTEEQSWDRDTTDTYLPYVDKIYTICPPSITKREKREYCFFPFNEKFIPKTFSKKYDVIYCGGIGHGAHITEIINPMLNFNYRLVAWDDHPTVTNKGASYSEKIDLISKSKITVVHSMTGTGTPQIKTRPFEAAFCKSLILCKKDQWNIIEEWFEPNTEFLYYEDSKDLYRILRKVLDNYDDYKDIIEKAHTKALNNYTTRHFINKFLSK